MNQNCRIYNTYNLSYIRIKLSRAHSRIRLLQSYITMALLGFSKAIGGTKVPVWGAGMGCRLVVCLKSDFWTKLYDCTL